MCCYSCRVVMMIVMFVGVVCGWYRLYLCGVIHGVYVCVCVCVCVPMCRCIFVCVSVFFLMCWLHVLTTHSIGDAIYAQSQSMMRMRCLILLLMRVVYQR
jgi:hypothetical protein